MIRKNISIPVDQASLGLDPSFIRFSLFMNSIKSTESNDRLILNILRPKLIFRPKPFLTSALV